MHVKLHLYLMSQDETDTNEASSGAPSSRRAHRAKRVNAMQMWKQGIIDDRPIKERWSREFKNPRVKRLKDPGSNFDCEKTKKGLVLEVHRRTCSIRLDDSEIISATYRTAVVHELGEFPAVGDRVVVGFTESTDKKGAYSLLRVLPRTSALKRPGPRDRFRKELTLAANIDQVVIVASVSQPPFNYGFADRFLLAANLCNLPLVMVLNKMDLVEEIPSGIREFMTLVDDFIPISCASGEGMDRLRAQLQNKNSVFSGLSGVGKSSLINRLVPEAALRTGDVRDKDGKGRHTTTSSSLFDLPGGGWVIDTPGIRALGLMEMNPQDLARLFPGFFPDDRFTCKYNNCMHQSEPGCTVREGVRENRISQARFDSYLRILQAKD